MFRVLIVAAVAALLAACHPHPNPTPPQVSGDVCLALLPKGAADPQPRDVHMTIDPNKMVLHTSLCIVSNATKAYAAITAQVTAFTKGDEFTSSSSNSLYYVSPTIDNLPRTPSIHAPLAVDIPIDPKYVDMGIKGTLMITLTWFPCVANTDTGTACQTNNQPEVATFMRDLAP